MMRNAEKAAGHVCFAGDNGAACAALAANCSATGGADECTAQPCPTPGPCQMCEGYCAQRGKIVGLGTIAHTHTHTHTPVF